MVATLYCAGNRRRELMEVSPMPGKLAWDAGAAGNARWAGISLRSFWSLQNGLGDCELVSIDPR